MKNLNPILLGVLLLGGAVCLPTVGRAGEKASGERGERLRERMQEVAAKLGLTDEQKEKLKPIIQTELEKLKELHADKSLTREQKIEKLKAIKAELAPQVKEILTPEQLAKWQEMREEFREKRHQRQ